MAGNKTVEDHLRRLFDDGFFCQLVDDQGVGAVKAAFFRLLKDYERAKKRPIGRPKKWNPNRPVELWIAVSITQKKIQTALKEALADKHREGDELVIDPLSPDELPQTQSAARRLHYQGKEQMEKWKKEGDKVDTQVMQLTIDDEGYAHLTSRKGEKILRYDQWMRMLDQTKWFIDKGLAEEFLYFSAPDRIIRLHKSAKK